MRYQESDIKNELLRPQTFKVFLKTNHLKKNLLEYTKYNVSNEKKKAIMRPGFEQKNNRIVHGPRLPVLK